MSRALPLLILVACATPMPSAPYGSVTWAQQSYNQAVDQCQRAHSRNMSAERGQLVSSDDVSLNACLDGAKANLAEQVQLAR
jgi:hypothetical protein